MVAINIQSQWRMLTHFLREVEQKKLKIDTKKELIEMRIRKIHTSGSDID